MEHYPYYPNTSGSEARYELHCKDDVSLAEIPVEAWYMEFPYHVRPGRIRPDSEGDEEIQSQYFQRDRDEVGHLWIVADSNW